MGSQIDNKCLRLGLTCEAITARLGNRSTIERLNLLRGNRRHLLLQNTRFFAVPLQLHIGLSSKLKYKNMSPFLKKQFFFFIYYII